MLEYNGIYLLLQAQAIMLMASSGNYSSYPHTKVQNGWVSQTEQNAGYISISVPVIKLLKGSGIEPQPSSTQLRTGMINDRTSSVFIRAEIHKKILESVSLNIPTRFSL
jgi:hypothetical protein